MLANKYCQNSIDTHTLRSHCQVRSFGVTRHWMKFPSCLDKFVQISDRADIRVGECLDGKVTGDSQDDNRVEVVRKESNKIRT